MKNQPVQFAFAIAEHSSTYLPCVTLSNTRAIALSSGLGIGAFAGLIGLGGAELRMPILLGPIGLPPQRAVPVNLCVSLVTLAVGLVTRLAVLRPDVSRLGWEVLALAVGSVLASFMASSMLHRLSDGLHTKLIAMLLFLVAGLMVVTTVISSGAGFLPQAQGIRLVAGFLIGLLVGIVSATFGVAGGQMTIPALIFAFGLDIKLAGTASLLVNFPTVLAAVLRNAAVGSFRANADLSVVAMPMAAGSLAGAAAGGLFVGVMPASILRLLFAVVLVWSSMGMLRRRKEALAISRSKLIPAPSVGREGIKLE